MVLPGLMAGFAVDETELEVKVLWPCWMVCVSGPELEGPAG